MRNVLLALMLVPPAACVLATLAMRAQLTGFRRDVPRLRTADDMRRLRHVAKLQMYGTLMVFGLVAVPLLVWIYGKFVAGALGWLDLLWFVILPFVVLFILTGVFDAPADEVRATPAETPELERERDQVADVWVNKNFPDW